VATPETRYARSGGSEIAYQVVGQASRDLLFVPGFPSNLDLMHEEAGFRHLLRRLAGFARVVILDPRGSGLSDRIPAGAAPTLEERMKDVLSVMDAAGIGRAAVLGAGDGAALAMLLAAHVPDRVRSLVLYAGYAQFSSAVAARKDLDDLLAEIARGWGRGVMLTRLAPDRSEDSRFLAWLARLERLSATPAAAAALTRLNAAIDIRESLAKLRIPTLLLHRQDDRFVRPAGRKLLAGKIEGATVIELPGRDHAIFSGDVDAVADRIETFVTGSAPLPDPDRTLATILVARLVAPERSAALFGDRDWSERVERLHADIRDALGRSGGEPVDFNAERIIARFDGPAHAIRFALGMRDTTEAPELRPAFGIHVGEVSVGRSSISGLALHVAQQIAAEAKSGEIVISAVVRELMSGVGYRFAERGSTTMPANGGALRLLSVSAEQHLEPVTRLAGAPSLDMLTDREREILTLVANGLSNPAIAKRLDLSDHTVKRHVANILLKLDLPTRAAAAALVGRQRAL
jgi:pimeloyl-ACP methyl ester carboxylesterase/DNA-binding CsgD family transcriptional regulator